MLLTIVAAGTRGDVQPFASLGSALVDRGHAVRLATHARFGSLVASYGLDFAELPGDPRSVLEHPRWGGVSRWRPFSHGKDLDAVMQSLLSEISREDYRRVCGGADAVVFTLTTATAKYVADDLGLPSACATYLPFTRTRAFPHPIVASGLRFGAIGNQLSYAVGERAMRTPFQEPLKPSTRRSKGLTLLPMGPAEPWPPFPVVYGYSPSMVPRPSDWPSHVHVTGLWDERGKQGALSDEIEEFLETGAPPLFIGFGSMRGRKSDGLSDAVLSALRRTGQRAIVQRGWAELGSNQRDEGQILAVDEVSHAALFPRVSAAVHHGGAGTTGASLRAGLPTLVVPFVFDQFFWGERVAALGAGPRPIPHYRLKPRNLARALQQLEDPVVRRRASSLGHAMRAERGEERAAELLDAAFR